MTPTSLPTSSKTANLGGRRGHAMRAELSPVVVLGATGQLGRALVATLGDRAVALSRARGLDPDGGYAGTSR